MTALFSTDRLSQTGRTVIIALALMAAIVPARASSPASGSAAQSRNETVVRAAFEKWAAGTGNVFDLLSPDIVWTIHGSGPVAGTYRGKEDFVERASRPLVSRLAKPIVPRVHHIWSVGDTVIVRFDGQATTTSGAPYRNQFVWIFRLRNEVVVEAEAFLDLAAYDRVVENNEPRRP